MSDTPKKIKCRPLLKTLRFKTKLTLNKYYQYARVVRGDRRWLLMFAVARFPVGRAIGTLFYSRRTGFDRETNQTILLNTDEANSIFPDLDVDLAVQSVEQNGYFLGVNLPQNIVREIVEFAYATDMSANGKPYWKFNYADTEGASRYSIDILVGNYATEDLQKCSAFNELIQDPKLRAIAAKYLNRDPVLVRSQMNWTFIGDERAYYEQGDIGSPTVLFHYDLDDYRAIKFFFYLTDVNSLSGSHRCVAGSHRRRNLMHYILRGQSNRKIEKYYGVENIVDICGSAGFGFAEDPFCFHRGSPPVTSPRLIVQLEFALNNYRVWN